jgi:hypothetical protein
VGFDKLPSPSIQNNNRELAVLKILLIAEIAVSGDDHFKTCGPGGSQEFAVFQFVPPACAAFRYQTERAFLSTRNVGGRYFGAMRGEIEDNLNLFPCHAELFHQFINGHVLEVIEHGGHPCTAPLAGDALYG